MKNKGKYTSAANEMATKPFLAASIIINIIIHAVQIIGKPIPNIFHVMASIDKTIPYKS